MRYTHPFDDTSQVVTLSVFQLPSEQVSRLVISFPESIGNARFFAGVIDILALRIGNVGAHGAKEEVDHAALVRGILSPSIRTEETKFSETCQGNQKYKNNRTIASRL